MGDFELTVALAIAARNAGITAYPTKGTFAEAALATEQMAARPCRD